MYRVFFSLSLNFLYLIIYGIIYSGLRYHFWLMTFYFYSSISIYQYVIKPY